jgi:hypothetical protein
MLNKIEFETLLNQFSYNAKEFLSEENCFLDQTGHFCYLRFTNVNYRNFLISQKKLTINFLELIISEPFCQSLFEMNNKKMAVKVPIEIKDDEYLLKMAFENLFNTEKVIFEKSNIFEDTFYISVEEEMNIENLYFNLYTQVYSINVYSFFETKSILVSKISEKKEELDLNYIVTYLNNKSSDSNSKVKEIREFKDFWLIIFFEEINTKFWRRHEVYCGNKKHELLIEPFCCFDLVKTNFEQFSVKIQSEEVSNREK